MVKVWTVFLSLITELQKTVNELRLPISQAAVAVHADVKLQLVWRGGPREGSGRDVIVPLMLQRDRHGQCRLRRLFQPSPPDALDGMRTPSTL